MCWGRNKLQRFGHSTRELCVRTGGTVLLPKRMPCKGSNSMSQTPLFAPCYSVSRRIDQLITTSRIPLDEEHSFLRYALHNIVGTMKIHVLLIPLALSALGLSAQTRGTPIAINGRVPLGIESFRLRPANQDFYLMASAENPIFVGLRRVSEGDRDK